MQIPVLIQESVISGGEPPFRQKDLSTLFRILVVTQHHGLGTGLDLPDPVFVRFRDPHFRFRHGRSHSAGLLAVIRVHGDDGRGLCQTIPFEHIDPQGPKIPDDLRIHRGAPDDEGPDILSDQIVDIFKHFMGTVQSELLQFFVEPHPFQQFFFFSLVPCGDQDLPVEGLIDQRHAQHGIDPVILQVPLDVFEAVREDDGPAPYHTGNDLAGECEGVVDRQYQQPPGGGVDEHPPQHILHVGGQVPVGQHNALGRSGGAGSEVDGHQRMRVDLLGGIALIPLRHQPVAFLHQRLQGQVPPLVGVPVHFDQVFHEVQFRHGGIHGLLLFFGVDQCGSLCSAKQVHQLRRRQFPVQRDDHTHAAANGEIGQHPIIPVLAHNSDLLALQTPVQQGRSQGIHILLQLPVGDHPPVSLSGAVPVFIGRKVGVVLCAVMDDVPDIR